jgi:hypothetical protein
MGDQIHLPPLPPSGDRIVSAQSLSKTGISAALAGDFSDFLVKVAAFWTTETGAKTTNRFRTRMLLPAQEGLKEPHFIKIQKPLETLDFREPYRTCEVQSSGEN